MTPKLFPIALLFFLWLPVSAQTTDNYQAGPDSMPQAGVPKGEVLKFTFDQSSIYPGTTRDYWVYVPTQYQPDKPACVYVQQDGIRFQAPTVLDNLINRREMPVTIAVFVAPGVMKAADSNTALDRFNRSYEYDGLGDAYVRFLLDELLPDVETKRATDGRAIKLSHDGRDRAIGGESSGAIAAFTAAWERPDAFSRVFSAIGTYVDLRGGMRYPTLIRKYEPKPIRIFMQDGANDLNLYAGDWWMANQTMERALTFAGYEVQHAWGDGGHNGKHSTMIFPDAMRWLWEGWPRAVKGGPTRNDMLASILIPGEGWQLVSDGHKLVDGPAANAKGEVFFNAVTNGETYKIGLDNKVTEFIADSKKGHGQAFGPDGRLYAVARGEQKVLVYDSNGKATALAKGMVGNDITVAHNGNIYVTNPPADNAIGQSKVWLIKPNGQKVVVDTGLNYASGVTLSPDQALLYVADYRSHWVYSYRIKADGTLDHKQRFYWLHVPDTSDQSNAAGLRVDREGRLYVATAMGIQICDQAGRVQCIIPTPNNRVSNFTFGGEHFDTLYATCGDRVYKRKLKVLGANAWDVPNKPAAPRL